MAKVYVLFYDVDEGDRENWNTFYTPCEVFADPETREARKNFVLTSLPGDGIEFHELDLDLSTAPNFPLHYNFSDEAFGR